MRGLRAHAQEPSNGQHNSVAFRRESGGRLRQTELMRSVRLSGKVTRRLPRFGLRPEKTDLQPGHRWDSTPCLEF